MPKNAKGWHSAFEIGRKRDQRISLQANTDQRNDFLCCNSLEKYNKAAHVCAL